MHKYVFTPFITFKDDKLWLMLLSWHQTYINACFFRQFRDIDYVFCMNNKLHQNEKIKNKTSIPVVIGELQKGFAHRIQIIWCGNQACTSYQIVSFVFDYFMLHTRENDVQIRAYWP